MRGAGSGSEAARSRACSPWPPPPHSSPFTLLHCVQTKALLNPKALEEFLLTQIKYLGTAACPPYHLAVVIGGTSAEYNLKTVKLASCK